MTRTSRAKGLGTLNKVVGEAGGRDLVEFINSQRVEFMSDEFPYRYKIEVDKAPRPKPPKQTAVIDQTGCTGCEACISFCPVDCIEIVPGPDHPDFMKLVEVDLMRCIGCQLCARYCPWETIDMWSWEEGVEVAPIKTIRSILYDYEPEQMHESADSRG